MWSTALIQAPSTLWKKRFHFEKKQTKVSVHTEKGPDYNDRPKKNAPHEHAYKDLFEFMFKEDSGREITWASWRQPFRNVPFSKCSLSTLRRLAGVFKLIHSGERFQKVPFSAENLSGLVWTEGLPVEIKLRFHIYPVKCGLTKLEISENFYLILRSKIIDISLSVLSLIIIGAWR